MIYKNDTVVVFDSHVRFDTKLEVSPRCLIPYQNLKAWYVHDLKTQACIRPVEWKCCQGLALRQIAQRLHYTHIWRWGANVYPVILQSFLSDQLSSNSVYHRPPHLSTDRCFCLFVCPDLQPKQLSSPCTVFSSSHSAVTNFIFILFIPENDIVCYRLIT